MSAASAAIAVASVPSSTSRKPPLPDTSKRDDGTLLDVETYGAGRRLIARRDIPEGAILFGENDWADEAEQQAFVTLSESEFAALAPEKRALFTRYGYNTARHEITGTFTPDAVRHPTNFANHACNPNSGYDGADHIVALRPIRAGDEITMDYGTFSFSFDHPFVCGCGAPNCRGKVTAQDWPQLVRAGLKLPSFMKDAAARVA